MVTRAVPKTFRILQAIAGFTNVEVAAFCRVSRQSVTDWRAGRQQPTPFHFDRLCFLFNCSPDELAAALKATRDKAR